MKIISISKSFNEETFGPVLKFTVEIPLEVMIDGPRVTGDEEFAKALGTELLQQIKEGIAQLNQENPA